MSNSSLKKVSSYLMLVLGGLIVGFGLMAMTDENSPARGLASLDLKQNWQTPMVGKHLAPLRVHINLPATLPERDDQELVVTGYVNLSQETTGAIQYKWTLPEGAILIEGHLEDQLVGVRPGQTVPIQISLVGFSKEQRKLLSLEANALVGKHQMTNGTVVSSRPEDSMEFVAHEKMKSREEFDKAAATLNQ